MTPFPFFGRQLLFQYLIMLSIKIQLPCCLFMLLIRLNISISFPTDSPKNSQNLVVLGENIVLLRFEPLFIVHLYVSALPQGYVVSYIQISLSFLSEFSFVKINVLYLLKFTRALFTARARSRGNGYYSICKDI